MVQPPHSPRLIKVEYSTFLARAGAHFIDRLLIGTLIWAIGIYVLGLNPNHTPSMLFELGALAGFFIYCHGRWGATPGKMLFKLRVISIDGKPVSYMQALLRYSPYLALGSLVIVLPQVDMQALKAAADAGDQTAQLPLEWQVFLQLNICWYVMSIIYMVYRKDRRTLHDILAYTVVVQQPSDPRRI